MVQPSIRGSNRWACSIPGELSTLHTFIKWFLSKNMNTFYHICVFCPIYVITFQIEDRKNIFKKNLFTKKERRWGHKRCDFCPCLYYVSVSFIRSQLITVACVKSPSIFVKHLSVKVCTTGIYAFSLISSLFMLLYIPTVFAELQMWK